MLREYEGQIPNPFVRIYVPWQQPEVCADITPPTEEPALTARAPHCEPNFE